MAGWGIKVKDSGASGDLAWVSLKILSYAKCRERHIAPRKEKEFCAMDPNAKQALGSVRTFYY